MTALASRAGRARQSYTVGPEQDLVAWECYYNITKHLVIYLSIYLLIFCLFVYYIFYQYDD